MKKKITYLGIERIIYEFRSYEVMQALMEKYEIKRSPNYEFAMFAGDEDTPPFAELVIKYSKPVKNEKT